MTRILIADDHEVVRSGLRAVLEAHDGWKIVAEAANGKDAIDKAVATKPHVAIIDYALPLINGLEATRQILARVPNAEVLVFTMHDSDVLIGEILAVGAKAYLLKTEAKAHLIAAVESLAGHKAFFTGTISERLRNSFLENYQNTREMVLSPRERVIVQMIAEGNSNKRISSLLNLSIKTIESHRATAMRKLDVGSTAGLVRYAIRNRIIEP